MQCLVAYGAVKAAGFLNKPVMDNVAHKEAGPEDVEVAVIGENKALIVKEGTAVESVNKVIKGYKKFSATPKYMVYN